MYSYYGAIREKIQSLDEINHSIVDGISQQLASRRMDPLAFYDIVSDKVAQLHRSRYDIEAVEYFREAFDIPTEDEKIRKAVHARGRNAMFHRLDDEEQGRLDRLCRDYGVFENVEESKKKWQSRLFAWYNRFEQKHPIPARTCVSGLGFIGGDIISHLVTGQDYRLRDFAVMAPVSAWYAIEIPWIYKQLNKIPIPTYRASFKDWREPRLLWKNLKRYKNKALRLAAHQAYAFIYWMPKHFAFLEFKKDHSASELLDMLTNADFYADIYRNSLELGIGQLIPVLLISYFIQNKIDLHYRFLATGTVNLFWSGVASMKSGHH